MARQPSEDVADRSYNRAPTFLPRVLYRFKSALSAELPDGPDFDDDGDIDEDEIIDVASPHSYGGPPLLCLCLRSAANSLCPLSVLITAIGTSLLLRNYDLDSSGRRNMIGWHA
jgi:hypothetical protein